MLLSAYFTPKVDFKRKFNHHQSLLYEWRLTDSKISNRTINTNRISNRTYDSKSNRITKLRRSLHFKHQFLDFVISCTTVTSSIALKSWDGSLTNTDENVLSYTSHTCVCSHAMHAGMHYDVIATRRGLSSIRMSTWNKYIKTSYSYASALQIIQVITRNRKPIYIRKLNQFHQFTYWWNWFNFLVNHTYKIDIHPLTFSFISPWVMCRFKQKLQWI